MTFDPQPILISVFNRLRQSGFCLGVSEYLAAVQAVEYGWGKSQEELAQVIKLLWCHSRIEQDQFQLIWESIVANSSQPTSKTSPKKPEFESSPKPSDAPPPSTSSQSFVKTEQQLQPNLAPLPVRVPLTTVESQDTGKLQSYWPISRRFMIYTWRYLRRPVADGPEDILDVQATIEQAANQGFFLSPIYRRREINHAHLLLLVDQDGSMTPFHRFTRDLVETAQDESTIEQVNVCYFHNIPAASVYRDAHMTQPVSLEAVLAECDSNTSILVVSDAGAARGYRSLDRIKATTEFLFHLKQRTSLIAWLNPMPQERWVSTSAQILTYLVPMFQMNDDGLRNAIDVVRGVGE